jgi:hypothetical protein
MSKDVLTIDTNECRAVISQTISGAWSVWFHYADPNRDSRSNSNYFTREEAAMAGLLHVLAQSQPEREKDL